jgi:hypothetical protein
MVTHTIRILSGGEVTIGSDGLDPFKLTRRDRAFIFAIAAAIDEYKNPPHAEDCQSQIAESDCNYDAPNEGACTCGAAEIAARPTDGGAKTK